MKIITQLFGARHYTALTMGVALLNIATTSAQSETVQILMGQDNESLFQADVVAIGLQKLGYTVSDIDQVAPAIYFQSVAQGDAQINAQTWWPMHRALYEKSGGDEKLELVGNLIENATQGYLIDKKTAEQYKISDISQLKDPELAKLFDSDGDGKANLAGCTAGWQCEKTINYQIKKYGLSDTVQQDTGESGAIYADVMARYKSGKPVLYYTWEPYWLNEELVPGRDVEGLSVPFNALPPEIDQAANTTVDGRNTGWEIVNIRITANREFVESNPAAKRFFELVSIPIADVNSQNNKLHQGENGRADIRRHAEEWVSANAAKFDAWVAEAKAVVQ